MLEHGGRLAAASRQFGIPLECWLDLSTGINPAGYPVGDIPANVWLRLPEEDDGLETAAAAYYGTPHLLPAAGTQAILQALPRLRAPCRIAMPAPTYAEHRKAWEFAGHNIILTTPENILSAAQDCDVVLLCNPNNPTGHRYPPEALLACHAELAARGGWLVVDEAFMDATPERSLTTYAGLPGLVILRSLGKFFGLAGARVGFVCAWPELLHQLQETLGPWPISGPSRWVARCALADTSWQQATREQLSQSSQQLAMLLTEHGLPPAGGTDLFQWVHTQHIGIEKIVTMHRKLAAHSIFTRLFGDPASLRFGLPGTSQDWQKLASALQTLHLQP